MCESCTYGAENEARTRDSLLGKQVLYQLSYFRITGRLRRSATSGTPALFLGGTSKTRNANSHSTDSALQMPTDGSHKVFSALSSFIDNGRSNRTRTCGILLPKQALYQTELHPEGLTVKNPKNTVHTPCGRLHGGSILFSDACHLLLPFRKSAKPNHETGF